MQQKRGEAFTVNFHKLVNEIKLPVGVGTSGGLLHQFTAVWDTGATNTVISKKVVEVVGLVDIIDQVDTYSADGPGKADAYYVNVQLLNGVNFANLKVVQMEIRDDLLIGMDIIGAGDFCLTNFSGETVLTFESPPHYRYDFVKQINVSRARTSRGKTLRKRR
jgi:hypothetical protein